MTTSTVVQRDPVMTESLPTYNALVAPLLGPRLLSSKALPWTYDNGGRAAAGYKGRTGDCVTRAISIGTGMGYQSVYDLVNDVSQDERTQYYRRGKRAGTVRSRSSARTGVFKPTTRKVLAQLGWQWHPTMAIGSGCQVHLAQGELPEDGTIIVKLSRHLCAVVNGVVHDTYDPGRDGTRCVYGYWTKP
jgi:hypothetical protein